MVNAIVVDVEDDGTIKINGLFIDIGFFDRLKVPFNKNISIKLTNPRVILNGSELKKKVVPR